MSKKSHRIMNSTRISCAKQRIEKQDVLCQLLGTAVAEMNVVPRETSDIHGWFVHSAVAGIERTIYTTRRGGNGCERVQLEMYARAIVLTSMRIQACCRSTHEKIAPSIHRTVQSSCVLSYMKLEVPSKECRPLKCRSFSPPFDLHVQRKVRRVLRERPAPSRRFVRSMNRFSRSLKRGTCALCMRDKLSR